MGEQSGVGLVSERIVGDDGSAFYTEACTITIDRAKSNDNVIKRYQDFLSVTFNDVARSFQSYTIDA